MTACSSDSEPAPAPGSSASEQASGPLLVFAAASLTEAFDDEKDTLHGEQPGLAITYNYAGSGTLVTQLQQGAPADVIATADIASMQQLVGAGLVETPTVFAHNQLEILVAAGNPKNIHAVEDLARADVTAVLADSSVPAGKYAAQVLSNARIRVTPKSLETDVKSAVARVMSGEADAAIVYATDVLAA